MELDPKIKVKKIFDVFSDVEEVKKYYGKEVYCADFIENFSNLKLYTNKFVLKNVFPEECKPFLVGGQQYRFILPAEFVEQEKQYRAYTIDEFLNHFICIAFQIRKIFNKIGTIYSFVKIFFYFFKI